MDAIKFLKIFKRICNYSKDSWCSTDCPLNSNKNGCSIYDDSIEAILNKVQKWEKEHPLIELTEQQKTAIKGRIAEGWKWATTNKMNTYFAFSAEKPYINKALNDFLVEGKWESTTCNIYNFVTFKNSPIYLPDLLKENEEK